MQEIGVNKKTMLIIGLRTLIFWH